MRPGPRAPVERADRRLLAGLVVSLLLHAVILLLQFAVPGMGATGSAPPLSVQIAGVNPPPAPLPAPVAAPLPTPPALVEATPPVPSPVAAPPLPEPTRPAAASAGFKLVDPVVPPAPLAAPAPTIAKRAVKKGKPRKARRISPPMPSPDVMAEPPRVLAQDATDNDFVVPLARPEDAEQKTVDIKDAQVGEDEGDATETADLEAEAARVGKIKAEAEADAVRLAEQAERELKEKSEEKTRQEQLRVAAVERDAREQAERTLAEAARANAQQVAALEQAEAVRIEQKKVEQERAEQQRAVEQQRLVQQRIEQQRAEQQRAEQQRVEQQRAEQHRAEKQRAEQQRAEQQRAEQQRAEQQRAEQQRGEQARAAQQRAADLAASQRGRDMAGTQPGGRQGDGGARGTSAGPGGVPGGARIPKDLLSSDLGNRARELVKGLDLLKGAPPTSRMPGERRAVVGASERDLPLKMYVESWREKIQRNGQINYPRSWADEVRIDPLVSVAVRRDGSVEEVTIIVSSGRADMDDAVRRIVRVNARFAPFPPSIAERYDVIEIRRVWRFDDKLILMEELR